MIEVLYSGPPSMEGARSPFTREEHRTNQTSLPKGGKRAPRRSQTQHEYFPPQSPGFTLYTIPQPPPIPENKPQTPSEPSQEPAQKAVEQTRPPARRPPLGPPRRSYSVTDQQPIPRRHKPTVRLALTDLPPELHFAIFDFLDPIDSTCFGLTNKHFYAIHRRLHGAVSLTARRNGPNELEWAWHLAGNVVSPSSFVAVGSKDTLSKLRVRGQGYCRMCGVTKCQLHKHIQEWMGEGREYCSVTQKYGPVAPEGSKSYCYMSKPGDKRSTNSLWCCKVDDAASALF
ncbi:hypothetical protein F5144DRAFT_498260 [Chaetomium tenue]|uniref:Uncharacterized protein n=1 Tax=Chaetomium tenue TaxID=1854479 RepID=A0ACB7NX38_9PEZI|nr:hypothetical protein F5144DRAFT_498260 [Chaetomium globosum]